MKSSIGWVIAGVGLLWSISVLEHLHDPGLSPFERGQIIGHAVIPVAMVIAGVVLTRVLKRK